MAPSAEDAVSDYQDEEEQNILEASDVLEEYEPELDMDQDEYEEDEGPMIIDATGGENYYLLPLR